MASLPTPSGAPARRPTLRDVAAVAGVSFKTVSRVVNGEPGVSPEVTSRVRSAADDLGYRPNAAATALRRADGRTATFGVLLEDAGNPFFASLLRGIEDVARQRGVAVFASSTDLDIDRELDMTEAFIARQVDAVIAAPTESDARHLRRAAAQGVRVVLVDRPVDGLDAPAVLIDNQCGAREGVQHLIAQGHRRIGYIGRDPSIYTSRGRYAGYVEALERAGIAVDPALVRLEGATRTSARVQIEDLLDLDDPPTALFTAQDIITMTAVSVMQSRGLSDRVALVGFDDFELADLLRPGVTVVAQDPRRIGALAAELALSPGVAEDGVHLVPTRLIERGSGEIPAPIR
jgi:LacI family transcriptional regulator